MREKSLGDSMRDAVSHLSADKEGVECGAYAVPNIGMHKMMYRRL